MARPKTRLNQSKKRLRRPAALLARLQEQCRQGGAQGECVEGRQQHRDGDGDGELLVKPSGNSGNERGRNEHRGEHQGNADHGSGDLFHGLEGGLFGRHPVFDVTLYGFHHDDGVIDHQADGEHQAEQREGVDGEAEQREEDEGADQRDGNGQQRNQCGAPALEEDVHHHDHQQDGDSQSLDNFADTLADGARRVERDIVVHACREARFHLGHQLLDAVGGVDGVRPRQLINRDDGTGVPIEPPGDGVILAAEFDAGHVLHADGTAIGGFANHDLAELVGGCETPLRSHGVGELLPWGDRFTAHLPGGIHRVLCLNGAHYFGDCDSQLGKLIRLHPQPHGILPGAKNLYTADAAQAGQLVVEIDVGVVREKLRVVGPIWGVQADEHQRRGDRFLHRDPVVVHFRRELRGGQGLAGLRQDEVDIGVGLHVEIDHQLHLTIGGGVGGIHVVHVVHAAHLLLDGRRHRLFDGLGVGAHIGGAHEDFGRGDGGEQSDRQPRDADRTHDHQNDGNDHRHDGAVDKEFRHINYLPWLRRC